MPFDSEAGTTSGENETSGSYAEILGGALAESTADKPVVTADAEVQADAGEVAVDTETAEQKAERLRDEKGRYAASLDKPAAPKVEEKPKVEQAPPVQAAPAVKAPSSWRKDMQEKFATLPPEVQQYALQRESEFAKGVSTYKAEYERLRPLEDAVAPFAPMLEGYQTPAQWIQTLGNVHKTLAYGTPQERVGMILQVVKDYNIPVGDYIAQGGQLPQFNPHEAHRQLPSPQVRQPDISALVRDELQKRESEQTAQQFIDAKDNEGNPKYPHVDRVMPDMIGLLQLGKANDLPGAYELALRLHDDLWQEQQQAQAAAQAAEKAKQAQAKATRAKSAAVSVSNSTRSANMSNGADRDLSGIYAEALGASATGRL